MMIISKSATNPSNIQPSEITTCEVFENQCAFIKAVGFDLSPGSVATTNNSDHQCNGMNACYPLPLLFNGQERRILIIAFDAKPNNLSGYTI